MSYIENPKTAGSGIVCAIPQDGPCNRGCPDCFFSHGRSYLEPLSENLPNLPGPEDVGPDDIIRVNDGHDSNVDRLKVIKDTNQWKGRRFFNTSIPQGFDEPWVLTINAYENGPAMMPPEKGDPFLRNLMFVRFRSTPWNLQDLENVISQWTLRRIPVVITPMAYHSEQSIPPPYLVYYERRVRHTNEYWVLKQPALDALHEMFDSPNWVHICASQKCKDCGFCKQQFKRVTHVVSENRPVATPGS